MESGRQEPVSRGGSGYFLEAQHIKADPVHSKCENILMKQVCLVTICTFVLSFPVLHWLVGEYVFCSIITSFETLKCFLIWWIGSQCIKYIFRTTGIVLEMLDSVQCLCWWFLALWKVIWLLPVTDETVKTWVSRHSPAPNKSITEVTDRNKTSVIPQRIRGSNVKIGIDAASAQSKHAYYSEKTCSVHWFSC